jgi:acyl dehydratase
VNAAAEIEPEWTGPTHEFAFPVEAGHVLAFARAIGESEDLVVAPPTFAAATDHFDPRYLRRPPRGRGWQAGLPASHLHVEQHFTYARPLRVGEHLTARKGPGRRWAKTGRSGALQFVEERTELRDAAGDLVLVMRWVDVHAERTHADLTNAQVADDAVVPERVAPPDGAVVVAETLSRTQFVMYAGASGDFHPLHHDDDLARRHGYPSVFAPGMFTMALTARALTDRVGHECLRSFGGRFRAQVWPGDTLDALVAEQPSGTGRAFTVTTRNQHGGLVFEATATTR